MGYFSQRKKQERVNFSLNLILIIIGILTILAFFDSSGSSLFDKISFWRFHYYVIMLLVFGYALLFRFFFQAIIAFLLLIVNFSVIASSANILSNSVGSNNQRVSVIYQNGTRRIEPLTKAGSKLGADIIGINHRHSLTFNKETAGQYKMFYKSAGLEKTFILTNKTPVRAGKLRLTSQHSASFMTLKENGRHFIFVNIDFSNLEENEEKTVFDNLAEFVLNQDNPVIIIGDFGIPAWSKTFRSFLNKTELEVKNHILMSDGRSWFNPFTIPTINVLAYRNVGLDDITILPSSHGHHPFYFELNL